MLFANAAIWRKNIPTMPLGEARVSSLMSWGVPVLSSLGNGDASVNITTGRIISEVHMSPIVMRSRKLPVAVQVSEKSTWTKDEQRISST